MMDNFESLVISLLDSDAMKGVFKKELSRLLNIPVLCIGDIWLETTLTNGVASQEVYVAVFDAMIKQEDLLKLPFKAFYNNCIVFEVGESIL